MPYSWTFMLYPVFPPLKTMPWTQSQIPKMSEQLQSRAPPLNPNNGFKVNRALSRIQPDCNENPSTIQRITSKIPEVVAQRVGLALSDRDRIRRACNHGSHLEGENCEEEKGALSNPDTEDILIYLRNELRWDISVIRTALEPLSIFKAVNTKINKLQSDVTFLSPRISQRTPAIGSYITPCELAVNCQWLLSCT